MQDESRWIFTRGEGALALGFAAALALIAGCGEASETGPETGDEGAAGNLSEDASAGADAGPKKLGPGEGYDFSDIEDQCGLNTGFPGDVLCLTPPPADKGFQIHLGPSSYDDPEEVAKYELGPGKETTECMYFRTPNERTVAYYERTIHMRPISHHIFLWLVSESAVPTEDRFGKWVSCRDNPGDTLGVIGGGEKPITVTPANGEYAPENQGLGRALAPNTVVRIEMHAFNPTTEPVLREAWANVYFVDRENVKQWVSDSGLYGGLSYATKPHTREVMRSSTRVRDKSRWLSMWGHGHSHMVRFSAWRTRGSERTLLLEDYDWQHPITLAFDTITENPKPNREQLLAGGFSGVMELQAGDEIEWECEVDNTSDNTLTFRNSVAGGEMCNLFGEFVGPGGGITQVFLQGHATPLE